MLAHPHTNDALRVRTAVLQLVSHSHHGNAYSLILGLRQPNRLRRQARTKIPTMAIKPYISRAGLDKIVNHSLN